MKRLLQASKDTYITNKVVSNRFRAIDANVGQAGTLDLFKLAGESSIAFVTASFSGSVFSPGNGPFVSGTNDPIEISRILIKFDLDPIRALTSSILNLSNPVISSSFRCTLKLSDVLGGQTVPSNFSIVVYPLSRSFDEGIGRDVYTFEDIDSTNFLTASVSSGVPVTWSQAPAEQASLDGSGSLVFIGGASHLGYIGQSIVDAVTGSTGLGPMFAEQAFVDGTEDAFFDVTRIVSATLAGLLPDQGFRLSFSGTQETDDRTRFVKRFASRHSTNTRIRPRLEVGFNDSIQDHHASFFFDVSGSLFLNNFVRGVPSNISGSSPLLLTLVTGSVASGTFYSASFNSTIHATGIYSATFVLSSHATASLQNELIQAHSATFTEIWGSIDGSVGYFTGTLVVNDFDRTAFVNAPDNLKINITNMRTAYKRSERIRFRVFAQDDGFNFIATRLPLESKSLIFDRMYYSIRDANSNDVIFDFDASLDSTRLSTDSDGMYFDVFMSDLDVGRVYSIDLMLDIGGSKQVFENVGGSFRIDA